MTTIPPRIDLPVVNWFEEAANYSLDHFQRQILFWDILRKRGNIYLDHLEKGQPPVLVFDYEMLMDGRKFERPVNFALVRIHDQRKGDGKLQGGMPDRRESGPRDSEAQEGPPKRPIVVMDPRAGHGPGIGGSKQDSEIGMALTSGHPVYFLLFFTNPCPGQTLTDVQRAQIRFLEEVCRLHPDAGKPSVIGNCQAGWAAALIAADRPDITGPLVLNGSPLSYWSGVDGANPMRYRGGLCGGVWINSFLSDLGNGFFDGANLVANFESLNPANTLWSKQYHLFANVDTEEKRYLDFEKWWGGFFMMTKDEIHFIVESLFVGNRLERGRLSLEDGATLDLKSLTEPIVIFASSGDNITPPQQALNWVGRVYDTTEDIKRHKQVIIYILHENIGHLGIFVSGKVAKKEHKEIIGSVSMIPYLAPGLYEMVIEEEPSKPWMNDYQVRFEERRIEDIMAYDDGVEDEEDFIPVATFSKATDQFYQAFVGPFVQAGSNRYTAELYKQMHPLRWKRYMFSDLNPMMLPFKTMAPIIKRHRKPVDETKNPFSRMEKQMSDMTEEGLNFYRDVRDRSDELLFKGIYGNPMLKFFFTPQIDTFINKKRSEEEEAGKTARRTEDRQFWLDQVEKGGFVEGLVRIMVATASADDILDRAELIMAGSIAREHEKLKKIDPSDFRRLVTEQSRILQTEKEAALNALPKLIRRKKDREEALAIAERIAHADEILADPEREMLATLRTAMNLT